MSPFLISLSAWVGIPPRDEEVADHSHSRALGFTGSVLIASNGSGCVATRPICVDCAHRGRRRPESLNASMGTLDLSRMRGHNHYCPANRRVDSIGYLFPDAGAQCLFRKTVNLGMGTVSPPPDFARRSTPVPAPPLFAEAGRLLHEPDIEQAPFRSLGRPPAYELLFSATPIPRRAGA